VVQRFTDRQHPLLTAPAAGRLGRPRVGHTLVTFARRYPIGMVAAFREIRQRMKEGRPG